MKKLVLLLTVLILGLQMSAQNDDHSGAITLTPSAMSGFSSLAVSGCDATVRNLGASTSAQAVQGAWTMSNDAWFQFTAVAEVAKIKVCSPTTFDAAIEIWNSTATTPIAGGTANVAGSGGKEYLCVSGLTVGSVYKVRVGRVSGSGAGTFNISYEHLGVEVRSGYYPDPPGAATCYDFTASIQRTLITYPVGNTRWTFIDEGGTVYGPFTLGYSITLQQCPGICEGHTYQVICEVNATDAECGNMWWGESTPRSITTCATSCPTLTVSTGGSCGSTFCNIFNVDFQASYLGTGFEYQFKFVTDNGNTEFCSAWTSTPIFSTSMAPYVNYFRYNKIYEVYVRARKCATDPVWCGPCIFNTCAIPYVSVTPAQCCRWRNKSGGGLITADAITGMDQYRFRFTPISINPCLTNPLTPQGPAITTNWSGSFAMNPAGYALTLGTVYNVQVQARKLSANMTQCDGTTVTVPGQQSDWGPVCLIGIRSSSSPAVGTALGCYCTPQSNMLDEDFVDELVRDDSYVIPDDIIQVVTSIFDGGVVINPADAGLTGNGILNIYNMNGQLVMTRNLYAMEQNSYMEIITESLLADGIYIISLQTDKGLISDKIFISRN